MRIDNRYRAETTSPGYDECWSVQCDVYNVSRDTCNVYSRRCHVTRVMCTACHVTRVWRVTREFARRHHCAPIGCLVGVTSRCTLSTVSTISTHPCCPPRHHVAPSLKQGTMSSIYIGASFITCRKSQILEEIAKYIGKWNEMYFVSTSSHTHGKSISV